MNNLNEAPETIAALAGKFAALAKQGETNGYDDDAMCAVALDYHEVCVLAKLLADVRDEADDEDLCFCMTLDEIKESHFDNEDGDYDDLSDEDIRKWMRQVQEDEADYNDEHRFDFMDGHKREWLRRVREARNTAK